VTQPSTAPEPDIRASAIEALTALFALGREVTSVLDLEELLQKIPELIAKLTNFQAFAVYLLDPKRNELTIAYSVGYPAEVARTLRVKVGEGLVGAAVEAGRPLIVNDVHADPRYVEAVPGSKSELVVPLRRKGRVIGALNLLSETQGQFTDVDEAVLRQFGAHVAVAIENARLFEHEREYTSTLETLAEVAREFGSILNLDELLTRLASVTRRVVDYRTFGILLVNEETQELEMKTAVRYGDQSVPTRVKIGTGLVGYAALHKEAVLVSDVSADPRYIQVVDDIRSELVIPLMLKDRCIGVFDLESPELDAFKKNDVQVLTLLASQAAVAIENARLYETIRTNEIRLEKEIRFAQRVQVALLPTELPKRLKGVDVAARFEPAYELGGDLYDFLAPEPHSLVIAVGDVSGKGVPAALYSAFAGELVRSRTFRRRYTSDRSSPAGVLASMNTILHERQLEPYYCTLCYSLFDFKRRTVVFANSGLPYPIRCSGETVAQIVLPGVPLGSFAGSAYDEVSYDLAAGDVYVFCTDGVFEANDARGHEFGIERMSQVVRESRQQPARVIVEEIFTAVADFRGEARAKDDMTVVALKINA
jgi:sigma-B regulation protein RsbU (phosphoserine phosphatase)